MNDRFPHGPLVGATALSRSNSASRLGIQVLEHDVIRAMQRGIRCARGAKPHHVQHVKFDEATDWPSAQPQRTLSNVTHALQLPLFGSLLAGLASNEPCPVFSL